MLFGTQLIDILTCGYTSYSLVEVVLNKLAVVAFKIFLIPSVGE